MCLEEGLDTLMVGEEVASDERGHAGLLATREGRA